MLRVILFPGTVARMTVTQAAIGILRGVHYAILAWGIAGWAVPSAPWLIAYLAAMPVIALQWLLNKNTCVLNNIETWLSTGRWRDPADAQQGGFIAGLIESASGWRPSPRAADLMSYGLLGLFWIFGAVHLASRI
jgi:hypothetical protein